MREKEGLNRWDARKKGISRHLANLAYVVVKSKLKRKQLES